MRRYPERRIVNALTVHDIATIIQDDSALIMVRILKIGKVTTLILKLTFLQAESNAISLIENSYKINHKCLVTMAESTFFGRPQGFTFPKNSPITKAIDYE